MGDGGDDNGRGEGGGGKGGGDGGGGDADGRGTVEGTEEVQVARAAVETPGRDGVSVGGSGKDVRRSRGSGSEGDGLSTVLCAPMADSQPRRNVPK